MSNVSQDLDLRESSSAVCDAASLEHWARGPLRAVLPWQGLLCGQYVAHAAGYSAINRFSFGLTDAYLAHVSCAGYNVRSPILARLIRSGGPEFFDSGLHGVGADPIWSRHFRDAGWNNILGLAHRSGAGDDDVLTVAGFYNVPAVVAQRAIQQQVMPTLHAILTRLHACKTARRAPSSLDVHVTAGDQSVLGLLIHGKTNKEIGKALGRSDETVKQRIAQLMRRFQVRNRVELVAVVLDAANARGAQA